LGKTVSFNNVSLGVLAVTFDGVGGGWTLSTAVAGTSAITITNGSFDTGNQTVAAASFTSSVTTARSVTLGSSTLTFSGASPWNTFTTTNLTFNAGTSTIVFSSVSGITVAGGGVTFYNVSLTDATSVGVSHLISGTNTFNNLTFTSPSVPGTKTISFGANQTINGTLTLGTGTTASNRIWIGSTPLGTQRTLTVATLAALANVDFRDIVAAGASGTWSGTSVGNLTNNSNITFSTPKTVYWNQVAGGNWSDAAWATSSGGTVDAANFPLAQDTAIIDDTGITTGNTITVSAANIGTLNVTKTAAMTLAFGSFNSNFVGNVTLQAATVVTGTNAWSFIYQGNTQTLTTNNASVAVGVTLLNIGGTLQLGSALTIAGNFTVTNGTFTTANYNVSVNNITSSNSNTRAISLGSSTVTILAGTPIDFTVTTGLTFTPGTSTIVCSSTTPVFSPSGITFYNVSFTSTAVGTTTITGANTYNNLTFTSPTSAGTRKVVISANQTVAGTFSPGTGGTATMRVAIRTSSSGSGPQRTLTVATLAAMADVDFQYIVAAGASGTWSGTRIGNGGNNSNITFDAAKTVYWNLAGAQNWSATGWATTSGGTPAVNNFPLAQDTAVFDNTGSVTGTISYTNEYFIGTLNVTKTGAMTLSFGGTSAPIMGNVTFQAATIITSTGNFNFNGTTTQVLTSNNCSFAAQIITNNIGGTLQLGSNFTTTSTSGIVHNYGTFDANNFNLTSPLFQSSNTNTRAILLGSGTHTFSGAAPWDITTTTGMTLTCGTSTIVCSGNSALTFAGGGLTYYNVSFTSTVVTNTSINGANTYNNLTFATPGSVGNKNIILNANQTVGGTLTFGSGGTATNRINVLGLSVGNQATITAATLAAMSDVDFRDIVAAGAAAPFTGTRIGNLGNNSGITFTAAKTVYWSLAAGGTWQSSTAWATSSGGAPAIANFPLAQDTAIIDDTGITTGNTINIGGANIGTLNVTKTNAVTLAFLTSPSNFTGSVTLQANTTVTGTNIWSFFHSTGTPVLSTNGSILPVGIQLTNNALQLGTAVTTTGTFTLTGGALDLNNYTLTCGIFGSSQGQFSRSIAFGTTGNITITGNNATVFIMTTMSNFTYTGTSAVNMTYSGSVGTRTITIGSTSGATESNVLNINVTAGGDQLAFTGTTYTKNLNLTGFAGALTSTSQVFYGNLTIPATTAVSTGGTSFTFSATSGTQVITTNGVIIDKPIAFSGTATYQLAGNLTAGGLGTSNSVTLTTGTLDLNGYVMSANVFSSNNSNTRAIAFNGGSISITGNNTTVFQVTTATGFTYTGTPTINFTYSGSVGTRNLRFGNGGGFTETNSPHINITAGSDIVDFAGGSKNLSFTGFSGTYSNNTKSIYGNFTMPVGVTASAGTLVTTFGATSGMQVISTNSVVQDYPITFNGVGGTFQLVSALTSGATRTVTLTNGTLQLKDGVTSTVGSFVTTGTTMKYLQSTTPGTQATISQASGTISTSYTFIRDINVTGGATWNANGSGNTNAGNNSGWTILPAWFISRINSNGVLFVPIGSKFDETTLNKISISPTVTYASNLDEITLQGQNIDKRENSDGTLMVNGYFDEVTGIL
jgi:hypothetical protein